MSTIADQIRDIDARIKRNGARLAAYLLTGTADSIKVQRGVLDRLLDTRLGLMRDRDRN